MKTNYIKKAVKNVGRTAICEACNVDPKAVRRWEANNKLPRTDYTGETDYAVKISQIPDCGVTFEQLLPMPASLKKRICSTMSKQAGLSHNQFSWVLAFLGVCLLAAMTFVVKH